MQTTSTLNKNYYEILEISVNSSQEEIRKAFRLKAVKYHPDKNQGDNYFITKFIEVREAYDILSEAKKKANYDVYFKAIFLNVEPQKQQSSKEERRKEKEKEEKFFHDPYKSFYSFQV